MSTILCTGMRDPRRARAARPAGRGSGRTRQAGVITMMSKEPVSPRGYQTKGEITGGPELLELVPQYRSGMKVKGRNKGETRGS